MQCFRRGTCRVTFLTSLTASLALPQLARADFYLHYWEDEHENQRDLRFDADAGYYLTKNDFDGAGNLLIPANFAQYSRVQTDVLVSYGLTSRFSVYGRLGWARTELDTNTTTPVSTNFGFTDSSAGLSFRAFDFSAPGKTDGITIDFQVQGDFPLYSNQNLTGPALGDGTVDVTGGAFGNIPLWHLKNSLVAVSGGAGFTYRSNSFSSAIPWSVAASLTPHDDGFKITCSVLGLESLDTDPRASGLAVGSTVLSQPTSGGSFITNAVNPSLVTVRGEVGYQFGQDMGFAAFAGQSVWGQAAPNGFYAGASIQARIGNHNKVDGAHLSPADYGRSNQGFVNYGLEAHVTRVNDRLNLVKIDRGSQDGIAVGQVFDVFLVKKDGNVGAAVARGHVSSVQMSESALNIDEYFKEIWIDEGFLAKRPVQ